jgi:hypothetical protein
VKSEVKPWPIDQLRLCCVVTTRYMVCAKCVGTPR